MGGALALARWTWHCIQVTTSAADFLTLAQREASRYGGDDLVFLRELLQNARDSGATRINIETNLESGVESISVTDDGQGMAMDHARRFLLTLYASSKKGDGGTAGRFGVGFWSILRFEPTEIRISSRPADSAEGWEIVFGSDLELREHRQCRMAVGTVVRMERPARSDGLGESAWNRVRRDARHLRKPAPSWELLEVTLNGRQVTEPMAPKKPGLVFRRPGIRGVVSLGKVSEVTLLAHGLRVRSAASVDDLLLRPDRRFKRSFRLPSSGLSPRVIFDCDRLEVLMDRGDVAQNRALVSVTRMIRSEIRRLCDMELERLAPRTRGRKLWDQLVKNRVVLGVAGLVVSGVIVGMMGAMRVEEESVVAGVSLRSGPTFEPYMDRSQTYGGPVTEAVDGRGGATAITYAPADHQPFLAAFRISGIDEVGRPIRAEGELRPAGEMRDRSNATLEIELVFQATGPLLRLPVPTGSTVDGNSVRLDGHDTKLWLTPEEEPIIQLGDMRSGRVAYRVIDGPSGGRIDGPWPRLPSVVGEMAARLKGVPPQQRVEKALRLVRSSLEGAGLFKGAGRGHSGFFGPVFNSGGGDCDVVNTVLAAVLSEGGLRSRLAVGWLGQGGVAQPGLHAWVEVDLGEGRWIAADATVPTENGARVQPPDSPFQVGLEEAPEVLPGAPLWWFGVPGGLLLFIGLGTLRWKRGSRRIFSGSTDLDPGPLVESLVRDREAWPGFVGAWRRALVPSFELQRRSLADVERAASRSALFVAQRVRARITSDFARPDVLQIWFGQLREIVGVARATLRISRLSPSRRCGAGGMRKGEVLLARTLNRGDWVAQVVDGGGLVIDGSTRAGRVAAEAFGAFDLDRWDSTWRRSQEDSFGLKVQECLSKAGMDVEIRLIGDAGNERVSALVLPRDGRTWVVVDQTHPEWRNCRDLAATRSEEAVFRAADHIFEGLRPAGPQTQDALAELARGVLKQFEGGKEGSGD